MSIDQFNDDDYTDLTPRQVEMKLRNLVNESELLMGDYAQAAAEAARDKVAYEVAHAAALLRQVGQDGTVQEKAARATQDTKEELFSYRAAEKIEAVSKEALRMKQAQMTVVQTISKQILAEWAQADRLSGGFRGKPE